MRRPRATHWWRHLHEIREFEKVMEKDGINFKSLSWQELLLNLNSDLGEEHAAYRDYMVGRYL